MMWMHYGPLIENQIPKFRPFASNHAVEVRYNLRGQTGDNLNQRTLLFERRNIDSDEEEDVIQYPTKLYRSNEIDRRQNLSTPIHQTQHQNLFHPVLNHEKRHITQSWETVNL